MFIQDKRAHLNDHIEASVDDHLELTWSSLVVAKQELDNMKDLRQKFHEIEEVNQKLTESVADSREEIRDLTMTVKSLEIQNIQLSKRMEDMERKTAKGKLTEFKADTRKEVYDLKLAIKRLETQNTNQKIKMTSLEVQMDQVKATRAYEKAQSLPSLQKSIPTQPVMLVSPPSSTSPYMSPGEESKKVQDIQESPACRKAKFLSLQKSIPTQPLMLGSPPASTTPFLSPREESKKVQDVEESLNRVVKLVLKN